MEVALRRMKLSQLLHAVRDLERRGWECIAPVQKIANEKKIFDYDEKIGRFKDFKCVEGYEYYYVKMRKVDKE
ncbi:hypothetical protein [Brevibacillus sp. MCWH]|uniref:hypothetical protein n=1 Tax=Brevibacillus sp. MCWH TaxID=2508871 RepID=UPI001491DEF5|nr:hypothetical protein [Brevibacillus sp. MCWH]NNV04659.1 hypothetical protein [Brevibacillus sp. MCWH]